MTRGRRRHAAAFVLGAASVLGFAPFSFFFLPPLALAVLFRLWQAATPRVAALQGLVFGAGWFLAGVSWVYVSMHEFGGMPAPLAVLATCLFCLCLALFPALAGYAFAQLKCGRMASDVPLAAGVWTLTEWLRGWALTGFPWLASGYAQTPPSPLAGYAPVLGVFGVGFVAAFMAALMALAWNRRERRVHAAFAATALLGIGAGLAQLEWTQPSNRPITVSLLQGNIEQSLKWKPERLQQSLETYLRLARAHPAQLIVLPETAMPLAFDQLPQDYIAALRRPPRQGPATDDGSNILLGIAARDAEGRYYNSAALLGPVQKVVYSKNHLVPFGEFTPPLFMWTLALMNIPMSNFSAGGDRQEPVEIAGEKIAVNICYEDAFGDAIIRSLPDATLLVNLSNTAWFGDSLAQPQHLQIAQMRALETGRPMLRATNTGMTAVVGAQGRIERVLIPFTEGALTAEVMGYSGATPFARWGNYAVLVLAAIAVLAPLARSGRVER
jgi:apolipoprotein N-acyltransferase